MKNDFIVIRQKIIFEYLEKFPNAGNRTLASILFKNYPQFFNSYEDVRYVVRYLRGSAGVKSRKVLKNKKYVKVQPSTEF